MDLASIFLLNLAFPLFFELSLCQTDCNGCCDPNTYKVFNEPRRSINSIWKQGQTAICDRTLSLGWYRFTTYVGGKGRLHPSSADLTVTVQACINFFNISNGYHQPFNVKVRQCSGSSQFYVYYLKPAYSCAVAYCAGKDAVYWWPFFVLVLLCWREILVCSFWFVKLLIFRTSSLFPWGKSQVNMTLDAVPILEPRTFQNWLEFTV